MALLSEIIFILLHKYKIIIFTFYSISHFILHISLQMSHLSSPDRIYTFHFIHLQIVSIIIIIISPDLFPFSLIHSISSPTDHIITHSLT